MNGYQFHPNTQKINVLVGTQKKILGKTLMQAYIEDNLLSIFLMLIVSFEKEKNVNCNNTVSKKNTPRALKQFLIL